MLSRIYLNVQRGRESFNVGSDENMGFGKFYEMPVLRTELSVRGTELLCVNNLSIFCRVAANYGKAQFWKPRMTPPPLGKRTVFFQLETEVYQWYSADSG